MANGGDGLRIYGVSDPTNPVRVGHSMTNYGGSANKVAAAGPYAYVANGSDGLRIYSLGLWLSIVHTNADTVLLSWPASISNCLPQQSSVCATTDWATLTNTPITVGFNNQVTIPAPTNSMFYRLVVQ